MGSFGRNLKEIIKKRGYKLGTFPVIYLNMSSQTFGHQLKNDNLKTETIAIILNILGIKFEDVINNTNTNTGINKSIYIYKAKPEDVRTEPKKTSKNYNGLKGLI